MKELRQSVVDYRELRAQKERLGLQYPDLRETTKQSSATIGKILTGREDVMLESLILLARALNLKVVVNFVPIPQEDQAAQVYELKRAV